MSFDINPREDICDEHENCISYEKYKKLDEENERLRKVVDLVKEYSTIWVSSRGKDMTRGWELIHEIAEALEAVKDEAKEGV